MLMRSVGLTMRKWVLLANAGQSKVLIVQTRSYGLYEVRLSSKVTKVVYRINTVLYTILLARTVHVHNCTCNAVYSTRSARVLPEIRKYGNKYLQVKWATTLLPEVKYDTFESISGSTTLYVQLLRPARCWWDLQYVYNVVLYTYVPSYVLYLYQHIRRTTQTRSHPR